VVVDDDETESLPFIQVKESSDMQYSPIKMSVGTGHYLKHPINFDSLLSESTCIENLDTGSMMQNDIEHAKALHKELDASADWIDLANTTMNMEEMITDGRVHIGVLKSAVIPNPNEDEEEIALPVIIEKGKWGKPEIEVDEMYVG